MRTSGKRTTDYLLVDISNSFTKIAFSSRRRLAKPVRHPTNELTIAVLRRVLSGRNVSAVVVSSVVPKKNRLIKVAAGKSRVLLLNPNLDLGVGIDYPLPRSIGADRLANAVAVAQLYGCPAIVVDFGT